MMFKTWLKYNIRSIVIKMLGYLGILLILVSQHYTPLTLIFVTLIYGVCVFLPLIQDAVSQIRMYRSIIHTIHSVEVPYIISDVAQFPESFEGVVLYTLFQELQNSMGRALDVAYQSQSDYQEYIELWIHEVKTPLAAALLRAENDKNQPLIDDLQRVSFYLDQALFYARSNATVNDYIVETVALRPLIQSVIKDYKEPLIKHRLTVDIQGDAVVYSDSKWVRFMIKQIVDNTVKYALIPGSQIRFIIQPSNQSISLVIEDGGSGVPKSDLKRIFQRGYTGQLGRKHHKATGMGLFLVKRLGDALRIETFATSDTAFQIHLVFPKSDFLNEDADL